MKYLPTLALIAIILAVSFALSAVYRRWSSPHQPGTVVEPSRVSVDNLSTPIVVTVDGVSAFRVEGRWGNQNYLWRKTSDGTLADNWAGRDHEAAYQLHLFRLAIEEPSE